MCQGRDPGIRLTPRSKKVAEADRKKRVGGSGLPILDERGRASAPTSTGTRQISVLAEAKASNSGHGLV
ncbi:unnamed protein product [Clonostachys rosea]|uniref:Uncharacterized protein n=1 Tax=Bionectria ochroleuca TaxID=29856 RepID=A0ABY6UB44_BIOOC|nr:unnamed protein product [Clonostachys rosea]